MGKKGQGGVKPPIIGKFTGKLRTPLSIIAGFFVLGVFMDLIFEWIARTLGPTVIKRVHVGFQFWQFIDKWDYTLPDGRTVDARETLAYDDLILLIITLVMLFIYKVSWKKRILATGGFFAGWYMSSIWISPRLPWQAPAGEETSTQSATGGF